MSTSFSNNDVEAARQAWQTDMAYVKMMMAVGAYVRDTHPPEAPIVLSTDVWWIAQQRCENTYAQYRALKDAAYESRVKALRQCLRPKF